MFNITIVSNQPPSVNETIPQLAFTIARTSTYAVCADAFTDPEGVALTFGGSASSSAPYLSIDPSTGVITSNNPTSGDVTPFTYTISASDGITGNADATQTVNVILIEDLPPTMSGTFPDISLLAYHPMDINLDETLFTDPNGDPITFTVTSTFPGWETINEAALQITGSTSNPRAGNYTVNISASDPNGNSNDYSFNVEIRTNTHPQTYMSTVTYNITGFHDFEVDLTTLFYEVDTEETLEYYLSGASTNVTSWSIIDNSTHRFYGTPTQFNFDVTQTFQIYAKDINFDTPVNVTVNLKRNDKPIRISNPSRLKCYEGALCTYDYSQHYSDPDNGTMNFDGSSISPSMTTSNCLNTVTGLFN